MESLESTLGIPWAAGGIQGWLGIQFLLLETNWQLIRALPICIPFSVSLGGHFLTLIAWVEADIRQPNEPFPRAAKPQLSTQGACRQQRIRRRNP